MRTGHTIKSSTPQPAAARIERHGSADTLIPCKMAAAIRSRSRLRKSLFASSGPGYEGASVRAFISAILALRCASYVNTRQFGSRRPPKGNLFDPGLFAYSRCPASLSEWSFR